jgi:teichuronic acid biosynthesis glycosyltransferase TuaC
MRVLVVTNLWPTPEAPARGGFVKDQVEALGAIEGLTVELFTFGLGSREYLRAARAIRARYRKERFDVVHAQYGLCGWSALATRGAPRVVTFHGTDLAHPYAGPLSRALVRLVDLPAPVSVTLARSGLPHARPPVAVLPCGVNLVRFDRIDRAEARNRLGLDPRGRYLLFPSDPRRPEKRHDRARSLADATQATLLAYGERPPDDIPLLINAANAVIATSEREGFGLAPLEALACDVAVLSTDVGIARLALEGIAGTLCARFDEGTWAEALAPHLDHEDPRVEGRARAALFDRNRLAQRVFHAYRDLTQTA